MRMKPCYILALVLVAILVATCTTAGPAATDTSASSTAAEKSPAESAVIEPQEPETAKTDPVLEQALAKLNTHFSEGMSKYAQGSYADGIKQLVTVLAEYGEMKIKDQALANIASQAETELAKIGSALALEADSDWLDENGNQIAASSLNPTLMPSVILTVRQESGRSLISNAPILFRFIKGTGTITRVVNTDGMGQASTNIGKMDNPQGENIIRASLVYTVKSYTYEFKGVERDFVYLPPSKNAVLMVMEKSPLGLATDPYVATPVYNLLKGNLDFDFSLYNGSLNEAQFKKIFEGDKDAIKKIGLDEQVSYLVIVFTDCFKISQFEHGGKTMQIFMAEAVATLRIIRILDSTVIYQASVECSHAEGTHGQGNTEQKAVIDVYKKITDNLFGLLEREMTKIKKSLLG